MDIIYHDYLRIFVNDNLSYDGEILIYEDNSCEGILTNKNNEQNYTYGTFEKNKCFNLTIENKDDSKIVFHGKKTYLQYEGNCKIIKDNKMTEMPFYLKVSNLSVDPRDYWPENNPNNIFLLKLNKFKEENIILNKNTTSFYNQTDVENNKKIR